MDTDSTLSSGAQSDGLPRHGSPVTMAHPARWLAVLRIVVGLYFVKSLVTKMSIVLLGGVVPVPAVSERWIE